ncbi:MAG: GGDEF domain-containing protein [Maricaulaceae bacterium]
MIGFSARILVVAERASAAGDAAARLDAAGFPTVSATGLRAALAAAEDFAVDGALIDGAGRTLAEVRELGEALKRQAAPRALPVIGVVEAGEAGAGGAGLDAVLRPPIHPAQLSQRIQSALRLAIMEEEVALRLETLQAQGKTLKPAAADDRPVKVLFVGEAAPFFLRLRNALEAVGANITAAFTSYTAFDYLHEADFDAAVLNGVSGLETMFAICGAMRRNSRLIHVPAAIIAGPSGFERAEEAFARGASEMMNKDAEAGEIRQRILELARERRRRLELRARVDHARGSGLADRDSGLYNAEFFTAHLGRMAKRARQHDRPLTLAAVRAVAEREVSPERLAAARNQFGAMLRHLVRGEDLAARLGPGVFAIAMPATPLPAAQAALARLAGVVECTAFEDDAPKKPFQLHLETRILDLQPLEGASHLIERATEVLSAR